MSGTLYVIGTGPGGPQQMTPEALDAVSKSTDFLGYGPYLDRLSLRLMWDTWSLTTGQAEALLRGVEETAVAAAFDPAASSGVAAASH